MLSTPMTIPEAAEIRMISTTAWPVAANERARAPKRGRSPR